MDDVERRIQFLAFLASVGFVLFLDGSFRALMAPLRVYRTTRLLLLSVGEHVAAGHSLPPGRGSTVSAEARLREAVKAGTAGPLGEPGPAAALWRWREPQRALPLRPGR